MLAILFMPFGLLAAKEIFKIAWLFNISILSAPDESYSRDTSSALN